METKWNNFYGHFWLVIEKPGLKAYSRSLYSWPLEDVSVPQRSLFMKGLGYRTVRRGIWRPAIHGTGRTVCVILRLHKTRRLNVGLFLDMVGAAHRVDYLGALHLWRETETKKKYLVQKLNHILISIMTGRIWFSKNHSVISETRVN